MFMSTNSVASAAELEAIKQWLKKSAEIAFKVNKLDISSLVESIPAAGWNRSSRQGNSL